MKAIILTLTAVLVTIAASAQTSFTTSKLAIAADDGGLEIDLSDSNIVQTLRDYQFTLSVVCENDSIVNFRSIMSSYSGICTFPGSATIYYSTINIPGYTLTVGDNYSVKCSLPSNFWFKLMCHNPYNYFRVRIFGADSNGDICFKQTIGTVWYNSNLVDGSHWLCYGGYTHLRDLNSYTFTLSDDVNEWTGSAADVVECFLCLSFGAY